MLEMSDAKGEVVLQRALELSRKQEAGSFELRTATTLARLWLDQRRANDAKALLAPIYERFDVGLDYRDQREAKGLLAKLG